MKLLIATQAVDLDDPILGFFHRWIEVLARHADLVHVICLREGKHSLPAHIQVHSLGKESGRSRIKYLSRLFRYAWSYRTEYDAVFVHMNQEYVLIAGMLWKFLGKRVVLWRNHKKGSLSTRIACFLADSVCYTSPDAFVASAKNAVRMPVGIDTDMFKPSGAIDRQSILSIGRLDPIKHNELLVKALEMIDSDGAEFHADIVGDPTEGHERYAHDLRNLAAPLALSGKLSMRGAMPHSETPRLFAAHDIYVNLTPSGSFDKTIIEALASGAIVVTRNEAVRHVVSDKLFVSKGTEDAVASALMHALGITEIDRAEITARGREYAIREHSLELLGQRIMPLLHV